MCFLAIATVFEAISVAEKRHEERFAALARNVEANEVFRKPTETTWRCRNCGYTHNGTEAPKACIACAHPQAHFEASTGLVSL